MVIPSSEAHYINGVDHQNNMLNYTILNEEIFFGWVPQLNESYGISEI